MSGRHAASPRRRLGSVIALGAFLAILAAVYAFVGDRTLWGEWISVAPPALWGVLLLPSAVRLRSFVLLGALGAFLAVTSEWPRFGAGEAFSLETIRVVSWNIGAGNGAWADAVMQVDPDIVLVQEGVKPVAIEDGFHWYGTLDPGTLSRFPAEVLPTEKVGPWVDPQLLLMEIRGRKVLVANVRLMLPSVVIQLVDPLGVSVCQCCAGTNRRSHRVALVQAGRLAGRRVQGRGAPERHSGRDQGFQGYLMPFPELPATSAGQARAHGVSPMNEGAGAWKPMAKRAAVPGA